MNNILEYYESISLKYKVVHKLKKDALILLVIATLGVIVIENFLKAINSLVADGLELFFISIIIYIFLNKYIKHVNSVITMNKDKIEMKKLNYVNLKNFDIESKKFFKAVNNYETNMIKKYLLKNKLMKKYKILFIIETLRNNKSNTNLVMNIQLVVIIPLAIAIGTNYISKVNIEDAGVFIFYCLIYVAIIAIIINVITLLIIMISEIIRFPIRDKQTFKILEDILSDIYLKMKK